MKKISQRTIETINRLTPEQLESRDAIARARNGGYLCPNPDCTNGSGKHGTGVSPNKKVENYTSWHCFSCNASFNNLQLLAWFYEIDIRSNFAALVEKICTDFDIELEYDDFDGRPKRKRRKKFSKFEVDDEPVSKTELEIIHKDLKASDEPLRRMYHYRSDDWRGLPLEILLRHGCRLINDWRPPSKRAQKKFSAPTPRMLIPCSRDSYLARLIIPVKSLDDDVQKCLEGKEKLHAGKKTLFNPDVLTSNEPVFAVEGYIDAMSIEHAGFKAVALGAATRGDLLVNAVAKMDGAKPQIIILLDGDDTGRKNAPIIHDELLSNSCPCVVRFLAGDDDNKLDCNEILTTQGRDSLSDKLQSILDDSLSELAAVEAAIAEKKEQRLLNDDVLNELFDGDLSDLDYSTRLEKFCGNRVRWQDDERWLTYSDGVWTPRSDKNSCVLPYARELFATLKEFAENDKERKFADAFKQTQKQNCAITLLKGCHSIRITADDLNQHRELLNCLNCVVDLSDGKIYSHNSSLLLTQQVNAAYDEHAQSELVDKFFRDIQPNDETRAGLLRWLGYCLTAETNAEKFMIWHGTGANGKGVLSEVMIALLGTYAAALNPRALLRSNRFVDANCATTALNAIEGKRFAISEELPLDGEIDLSLVKNFTGGDRINLRHNYGEYKTIKNLCKINLSGNYLPKIENVDDKGILRRLLNMPFSVQFGTDEHPADDKLKQKMLQPENLRGLLALLVRESVAWYRRDDGGLIISDEMKAATKRHLAQNNFVLDFLADNYRLDSSLATSAKTLLDELKVAYPYETARFKRADLINLIVNAGEGKITYCEGKDRYRIFKGVGKVFNAQKQRFDDLDGEPVNSRDVPFG